MSVRVEWMTSGFMSTRYVEDPSVMVDGQVSDGPAVVIEADNVVVIEGSRESLREWAASIIAQIDEEVRRSDPEA